MTIDQPNEHLDGTRGGPATAAGLPTGAPDLAYLRAIRSNATELFERAWCMLEELDYVVQLLPAPGWHVVHQYGTEHAYSEPLVGWALLASGDTEAVIRDPESLRGLTDVLRANERRWHDRSTVWPEADLAAALAYRGAYPHDGADDWP